jgi:amino acid transporter
LTVSSVKAGLLQATALNMSNMVGVGPFITIPLIIASMGGPQSMAGWLLGTILAACDGLIWSELAAAMPGSGGTYLYLREAFRPTGWAVCCRSCLSGNLSSAVPWRSHRAISASRNT